MSSNDIADKEISDLPVWLATTVPLVSYLVHFAGSAFGREFYDRYIDGEFGLTELATIGVLALTICFTIAALRISILRGQTVLTGWLALFLLGAIYFLGEEASWGQHVFGWQTPDYWLGLNDQHETNFHNTGGIIGALLDQFPRTLLTLSALILGFGYPAWRAFRSVRLDPSSLPFWLLPTSACITIGLIAPLASLPGKIPNVPASWLMVTYGEIKELLLGQFLMLYVMSIWFRQRGKTGSDHVQSA